MNKNEVQKNMAKDTMLYLPAKVLEGIIGLITINLYSHFFNPTVYGQYGMISTAISNASLLLLGWLSQSVFRYANDFEGNQKKRLFYSTTFMLWLSFNSLIVIACLAGIFLFNTGNERWLTELYLLSILMFVGYNTSHMLTMILAAIRKTRLLLFISIFSVSAKLLLTTFFVYQYKTNSFTPAAAVISIVLVDLFTNLLVVFRLKMFRCISFGFFSKSVFRKFLTYSLPLLGVNVAITVLNQSDRYVITGTLGEAQFGIYYGNYLISSTAFTLIQMGVMRGVYPMILKTWRQNNKPQTEYFLSQAVRYYLLVAMPALTGLCVLAQNISSAFLDVDYFEQGFVIVCVAIGMFLYGLAEYSNKAWELKSNTKPLFFNTWVSAIANVGMNLVFVPIYGYRFAAVSTALSYLIYLSLSMIRSRKLLKITLKPSSLLKIIMSCMIMGGIVYFLAHHLAPTTLNLALAVLIGFIAYFVCLLLSKEIDPEISFVLQWVRKRKNNKKNQD